MTNNITQELELITKYHSDNDNDALFVLATTTQNSEVKQKAINHIEDAAILLKVIIKFGFNSTESQTASKEIIKHLPTLFAETDNKEDIAEYLNYMQQEDLQNICKNTEYKSLAIAALTCINNQEGLADIAQNTKHHQVSCFAAEKITQLNLLEELTQKLPENDDSPLARIINKQFQKAKNTEKDQQENLEKATKLLQEFEQINNKTELTETTIVEFSQLLTVYKNHSFVESVVKTQIENIVSALETKKSAFNNRQQEAMHTIKIEKDITKSIKSCIKTLQDKLATLVNKQDISLLYASVMQSHKIYKDSQQDNALLQDNKEIYNTLTELEVQIKKIELISSQFDSFDKITSDINNINTNNILEMLDCIQKYNNMQITVATQWKATEKPKIIQNFIGLQDKVNAIELALKNKQAISYQQVKIYIEEIESNIQNIEHNKLIKRLNKAKQTAKLLEKAVKIDLLSKIANLEETLNKQKEAHNQEVFPKLEALCDLVENFKVDEKSTSKSIMLELKKCQAEWKLLSQGLTQNDYWGRFKEGVDKIYKAQAEIYNKKQTIKDENDNKRQEITDNLQIKVTEWKELPEVTPQEIIKYKNTAYQQWQDAKPFSSKTHNLNVIFHQLMLDIVALTSKTYEASISKKTKLITEAKAMLENQQLSYHEAITRNRLAMISWKEAGYCGTKDRDLWQEFQQARQELSKKFAQKNQQQQQINQQDITEAKRLIKATTQINEQKVNGNLIDKLQSDFSAIVWRDPKDKRYWQEIFNKKITKPQKQKDNIDIQKRKTLKDNINKAIQKAQNNNKDEFLEVLANMPNKMATTMQLAYENPSHSKNLDDDCILLEIALNIESPAEYKSKRSILQFQALQDKFNSSNKNTISNKELFLKVMVDAIKYLAIPEQNDESLQQRLVKLIEQAVHNIYK